MSTLLETRLRGMVNPRGQRVATARPRPDSSCAKRRCAGASDCSPQDPAPLDPDVTVERAYRAAVGDARADEVPLTAFGLIRPRDLARPPGVLSTGQLRRLELTIVLADPPEDCPGATEHA